MKLKKLVLLIGDLVFLGLSLALVLLFRYPKDEFANRWSGHWPSFLVVFLIWLLLFYINDLYNLNLRANSRKFFRSVFNAASLGSFFSIIYFYLNVRSEIAPRTNLLIFIIIFLTLFALWRRAFQSLSGSIIPHDNLALVGWNGPAQKLLAELSKHPGAGYQAALVIKAADELPRLAAAVQDRAIRAIVVCDDFGDSDRLRQTLFDCLAYQIAFFSYADFYELLTEKVPVEAIGQNWFLENLQERRKNYFNFLKRGWDFALAFLILAVSLPFWPLIALGIKLSSRGPAFFRQERAGKSGRHFIIIKFRTMRESGNDRSITVPGDGRITAFGSFLRRTRLDEIPQVINILKGEMSFIGPRPERPEIIEELKKKLPFYETRLLIKPGLTGWDQISGEYHSASELDSLEKLQYDLFYLKNRSFFLDLSITLKTIATVFSRAGR